MNKTGYHGTSLSSGKMILEGKGFKRSEGKSEWLGSGIYFYECFDDAFDWAVKAYKDNPCVLHSLINVNENEYIDFDTDKGINFYRSTIEMLEALQLSLIGNAQENQCFIANYIWKNFDKLKLLISSFPTEPSKISVLKDPRKYRREMCVKNDDCIGQTVELSPIAQYVNS